MMMMMIHSSHGNGLLPLWIHECLTRWYFVTKLLPHSHMITGLPLCAIPKPQSPQQWANMASVHAQLVRAPWQTSCRVCRKEMDGRPCGTACVRQDYPQTSAPRHTRRISESAPSSGNVLNVWSRCSWTKIFYHKHCMQTGVPSCELAYEWSIPLYNDSHAHIFRM